MIEIFTIVCPLFVKFSEEIHLPYISATQNKDFHCPTYPPPSAMKERRPSIPPQGPLSTAKQFTPSTIKMTFSSTIGAIQLNRDSESALSRVSSPDHIYILRFLKLTSPVVCVSFVHESISHELRY